MTLSEYAMSNLTNRADLAVRTTDHYRWLLTKHILPALGDKSLSAIDPSTVRVWHSRIAKTHSPTAAKAYRLLSSIMRAAVADEVITRNPCQVRGAAVEKAPERP